MADFKDIFRSFINLFAREQIQAILLAWIPSKLEPYFSGIIAVDMFITTLIATAITTLFYASCSLLQVFQLRKPLTVQIEYYVKELNNGSFIVQPTNSKNYESYEVLDFNILPENKEQIIIEYKGLSPTPMPSIYLSIINNDSSPNRFDVNAITEFINEVTWFYFKAKEKHHKRSRYKRNNGNWNRVQYLSNLNSLETVVLDEPQEILLKKELDSFVNDKEFYKLIGVPYRYGFLLYGKPGTGKTSLINAISSYLSRDLYYLNLKEIKNDNDMSAAFSSVPSNQIIVLEDVDTQSNVLYKRDRSPNHFNFISEDVLKEKDDLDKYKEIFTFISLSNFLGCLDGQTLLEGTIIVMTTNHVEHLDPACIRPGRMDVHLNLEYCTHYQIKKMYHKIISLVAIELISKCEMSKRKILTYCLELLILQLFILTFLCPALALAKVLAFDQTNGELNYNKGVEYVYIVLGWATTALELEIVLEEWRDFLVAHIGNRFKKLQEWKK
ncbi:27270_t:CDS:2 [Dentiscutata erythropus]|uniref:27270_t:CDS:1 n=1 Tax=Dentiscutata erythropus TaxID=1348616 RepID=A0A9N8VAU6_9GLOM|nr:27270_t:CDS:2 [Dentiscutata erythropus]